MAFALATSRKALQVTCKATGKKTAAKARIISYNQIEIVCKPRYTLSKSLVRI